ncbi:hypothetical protein SAMN05444281_2262 [Wenyingzhuangia marina]|uniref:DNA topoisomerase IV n=2 Tax=Wenyingzhuangia marina TaxID=1195760 RepID=A0A1M5W6L6_9FLAO|nr:hypothetical protein SAMN05444281_2262 [Wenyingzhuangia marina]
MRFLLYIISAFVFISCNTGNKTDVMSFREGHFKTYLGERKDSSTFYRNKNLQIETYKSKTDTFHIRWISNFEYELLKTNPKSKLDSIPFKVRITAIKNNYYKFKGAYEGSDFVQTGTSHIIQE